MRTIQKLPSSGDEREALRVKGQFWTPPWLAKVMAGWVTQDRPEVLFDPAVGPGTFFADAVRRALQASSTASNFTQTPSPIAGNSA